MKKLITTLAFVICTSLGFSQTLQWKQSYGSTGAEVGYSTHVDVAGNNYSGGTFTNTIVAGNDGESNLSISATGTNSNGYLIKKQPTGILLWSAAFVGAGNCVVHGIATDASNNVFITGYFTGTIDFNPSPSINNSLTAAGNTGTNDFFVCKLTSAGAYAWAYRFGEINNDYGLDIALDQSGNVHIAGSFNTQNSGSGVVDFDPSASASTMSSSGPDGFLLKLSNSGTFLAKQKMGGANTDGIRSISISVDNKIYVTGNYSFDGFPGLNTGLTTLGAGIQLIIAKLEASNYTPIWQRGYGGDYEEVGYGVDTDGYGSIYICGIFRGNVTLATTGFYLTNPSNVYYNGFIMKMNTDGTITWVRQLNGNDAGDIIVAKLKADKLDNIILTGYFQGNILLNPNSTTTHQFVSTDGSIDAFAIKMNQAGNLVGSPIVYASAGDDKTYSVATSGNDFYITGNFSNTVDADITATTSNLVSAGSTDAFFVKYSETTCNTPTIVSTNVVPACGPSANVTLNAVANFGTLNWYVNPSGGSVQATGNTYTFTPGTTTTRYVSATLGTCTSARVAVEATVYVKPGVSSTAPSFDICTGQSATLGATINNSSALIIWYETATSTTPIDTGSTFVTPVLTSSRSYYAEGNLNGCVSNSRELVSVNVNAIPTITSKQDGGKCSGSSSQVVISAIPSVGTIDWYASNSGGSKITSGLSLSAGISVTTVYYAQANFVGCLSTSRTPVTAYVSAAPTLTVPARGDTVCVGEQATLTASTTAGIVIWYNSSITALDTGTVFLTPALSDTTTYLVRANNNYCLVDKYTIAFTKPQPSVAVTVSGSTLTAVETGATYQWASCGNKNSFTPVINGTSQSYTAPASGSYAVFITKNGCKDTSVCNNVVITDLNDNEVSNEALKMYPNPNNGTFIIEMGTSVSEIEIINQLGQKIKNLRTEGNTTIHIENLPSGIYVVRTTQDGKTTMGKVVVNKF